MEFSAVFSNGLSLAAIIISFAAFLRTKRAADRQERANNVSLRSEILSKLDRQVRSLEKMREKYVGVMSVISSIQAIVAKDEKFNELLRESAFPKEQHDAVLGSLDSLLLKQQKFFSYAESLPTENVVDLQEYVSHKIEWLNSEIEDFDGEISRMLGVSKEALDLIESRVKP